MHRHNGSDLEDKSYWTRCIAGLKRYETTKRTALKCIKVLELTAQSFAQKLLFSTSARDANRLPQMPPVNPPFATGNLPLQLDKDWEANVPDMHVINPAGIDSAGLPNLILDESIDFSWLSAAPFELDPDELNGPLW